MTVASQVAPGEGRLAGRVAPILEASSPWVTGIGTVIALMLPYFVALVIVRTLFFVLWYVLGVPFGPGAPA